MVTCLKIHLYKYKLAGPGIRLAGAVFLYGWISRKQGRVADSACLMQLSLCRQIHIFKQGALGESIPGSAFAGSAGLG